MDTAVLPPLPLVHNNDTQRSTEEQIASLKKQILDSESNLKAQNGTFFILKIFLKKYFFKIMLVSLKYSYIFIYRFVTITKTGLN